MLLLPMAEMPVAVVPSTAIAAFLPDSRISVTVPIAVINTIGRSVAGDIDCQIISHGRTAFMGGIIADGTEAEGIYISLSIYCDC